MTRPPEVTAEARDLFRAFCLMKQYGHLPVQGGFLKQSAKFLNAIEYCDAVNIAYLKRKQREEEQKAKGKEFLARMFGDSSSGIG